MRRTGGLSGGAGSPESTPVFSKLTNAALRDGKVFLRPTGSDATLRIKVGGDSPGAVALGKASGRQSSAIEGKA